MSQLVAICWSVNIALNFGQDKLCHLWFHFLSGSKIPGLDKKAELDWYVGDCAILCHLNLQRWQGSAQNSLLQDCSNRPDYTSIRAAKTCVEIQAFCYSLFNC